MESIRAIGQMLEARTYSNNSCLGRVDSDEEGADGIGGGGGSSKPTGRLPPKPSTAAVATKENSVIRDVAVHAR